jgi:sedoheptulokinase
MLDIHSLQWHKESVKRLRLPSSVLPRIVPSLSPVGHLKRDAANSLGLSTRTRVFAPIGDHQATCWAAGPARSDGLIFNLGTGGQVSWYTRRSEVINGLETRPMPGGGYIAVGASINGGWAYQYLAELFRDVVKQLGFGNPSTQDVFGRMLQLHGHETPARLRVDPSFSGTRIAPNAMGSITDISRENLTPANLAAAFSAGMVNELVSMIPKPILRRVSVVTAGGSGFRENPWAAQVLQDQFQACPIEILPETRDASLGAGLATISLSRETLHDAG